MQGGFYIIIACVFFVVGLAFANIYFENKDRDRFRQGATFVEVDGGKIRYQLSGTEHSAPTVILEAGLCGISSDWNLIQQEIAKKNPVLSYDRAGTGWSDPPHNADHIDAFAAAQVAKRLHGLIESLQLKPPFILVGHSLAGLYLRVYQQMYPEQIAGIFLIDPMTIDDLTRLPKKDIDGMYDFFGKMKRGYFASFLGIPRWLHSHAFLGGKLPSPAHDEIQALGKSRQHLLGIYRETEAYPLSLSQATKAELPGELPLFLVSATLPAEEGVWVFQTLHREMASHSKNGHHQLIANADHNDLLSDKDASLETYKQIEAFISAINSSSYNIK